MFSYQKLQVYQKAFELNQKVYKLLKGNPGIPGYAKNQLGRASLIIVLNIAEGSAKFSKKDRRNFFIIARASAFESAALIEILCAEKEIAEEQKRNLIRALEEISRMLYVMIHNLKFQYKDNKRAEKEYRFCTLVD